MFPLCILLLLLVNSAFSRYPFSHIEELKYLAPKIVHSPEDQHGDFKVWLEVLLPASTLKDLPFPLVKENDQVGQEGERLFPFHLYRENDPSSVWIDFGGLVIFVEVDILKIISLI